MSKPMDPQTAAVCKQALAALARVAPDGMAKDSLMDVAQSAVGRPLTTAERERVFFTLRDRGWVMKRTNSYTGMETWGVTPDGSDAMEAI